MGTSKFPIRPISVTEYINIRKVSSDYFLKHYIILLRSLVTLFGLKNKPVADLYLHRNDTCMKI